MARPGTACPGEDGNGMVDLGKSLNCSNVLRDWRGLAGQGQARIGGARTPGHVCKRPTTFWRFAVCTWKREDIEGHEDRVVPEGIYIPVGVKPGERLPYLSDKLYKIMSWARGRCVCCRNHIVTEQSYSFESAECSAGRGTHFGQQHCPKWKELKEWGV